MKKFLLLITKKNNKKESKEICILFGRGNFNSFFYPMECIKEQRYEKFENIYLDYNSYVNNPNDENLQKIEMNIRL